MKRYVRFETLRDSDHLLPSPDKLLRPHLFVESNCFNRAATVSKGCNCNRLKPSPTTFSCVSTFSRDLFSRPLFSAPFLATFSQTPFPTILKVQTKKCKLQRAPLAVLEAMDSELQVMTPKLFSNPSKPFSKGSMHTGCSHGAHGKPRTLIETLNAYTTCACVLLHPTDCTPVPM